VLQFDHHCVWLNNCIGYNNYRSFFLVLFFLMIGCWYGTAILFWVFYEPLKAQIEEHGWRGLLGPEHGTGLLDLPSPLDIPYLLWNSQVSTKQVVDMVYPLLFGVGAVMSGFAGVHVRYILKAQTSLEHRILLERQAVSLFHAKKITDTVNPFDQGWIKNVRQALGDNLWLIFLPIKVQSPRPFVPRVDKNK
jgi:hypothetical protein